jgi:hypothetical protein
MIRPLRLGSSCAILCAAALHAATPVAQTPPMGWNSYDSLGTSITEAETLANARAMQEKLLAHGWRYLVIDARWYDSVSSFDDRDFNKERAGAKLLSMTARTHENVS